MVDLEGSVNLLSDL